MPAIKGKGIKFGYAAAATQKNAASGFTLVPGVIDAKVGEPEVEEIDTTNHDTTGIARTYMAGLEDGGEYEVTFLYDKALKGTLDAMRGVDKVFQILFSDASGEGFDGFIKSSTSEHPIDDVSTMTFKMKVSGTIDPFATVGT